jgi:TRAP-type C4-dicarboxylate transport system substrate-binding protein
VGIGPEILFTRRPVRSLDELLHTRLWIWSSDDTLLPGMQALGVPVVGETPDRAARLYDEGRVDGFIAAPLAALAFQWSSQVRYLTPLRVATLNACVIVVQHAFDRLSSESQTALRREIAKALVRLEDSGRAQDEALLGGLFSKQGVTTVPISATFRAQFFRAALETRERIGARLVGKHTLEHVLALLADFRAEHRDSEAR